MARQAAGSKLQAASDKLQACDIMPIYFYNKYIMVAGNRKE
jgi:hypothetical protein